MKPKQCKICKIKYMPTQLIQQVCSPLCAIEYSKIHLPKQKSLEAKKKRVDNKAKLKEIEPLEYWKKKLEERINKIVRLIDYRCSCISSGREYKPNDQAGHYKSVGSTPTLRFNLFNIYSQSVHDNKYKGGNLIHYSERLHLLGLYDYFMEQRLKYPTLHITKEEIKEVLPIAKSVILELQKLNQEEFTPRSIEKRIELRLKYQKQLNIYK